MSDEFETQDGEVLPNREVMSIISTDPVEVLVPPEDGEMPPEDGEMRIQPYPYPAEEPRDPGPTLPVEEPPAA